MLFGTMHFRKSSSSGVAARWTSISILFIASRTAVKSVSVPTIDSSARDVGTRSKPRTKCPRAFNSRTAARPRRPAEPVIRTRLRSIIGISGIGVRRLVSWQYTECDWGDELAPGVDSTPALHLTTHGVWHDSHDSVFCPVRGDYWRSI